MPRQVNMEGRPVADFRGNLDVTVALADNAIDRGQSQTGPFAHFLGGEKRLKNAGAGDFVHPATGVLDRQEHGISRPRWAIDPQEIVIQNGVSSGDREPSSL